MQRKNRINVRLNDAELRQLNLLSAKYGDSQSATFRTLLSITEWQDHFENNQKKSATEINQLQTEIVGLKNQVFELGKWLKEHIE